MGMLDGKVAIVTGAGRGIGQATAELFAEQGADIVVVDLDAGPAEETAALVKKNGRRALVIPGNLCEPGLPKQIMTATAEKFGRLDILINNAGFTADGVIHKMPDEQFQIMLDIHLLAPFRLIREAAPLMRDQAKKELEQGIIVHRKIVNISSASGTHGNPGQINYSAAKSGVIGMTKTVAKEWAGFHINCNVVAFGPVDTRLMGSKEAGIKVMGYAVGIPGHDPWQAGQTLPLGRSALPRDAASTIFYLASPLSDMLTGRLVELDSGLYM